MPRNSFVFFISNLWELSDKELDTIKDLAVQGKVAGSICLLVQNCSSKPGTSYHFNLKGPMLSLTLNPLSTPEHVCCCHSPQSDQRILLSTSLPKKRKKKVFDDFLQAAETSWTKVPLCNPRWSFKLTEGALTTEVVLFRPLCLCSSDGLDPTLSCPILHTFFRDWSHWA